MGCPALGPGRSVNDQGSDAWRDRVPESLGRVSMRLRDRLSRDDLSENFLELVDRDLDLTIRPDYNVTQIRSRERRPC